MNTLKLCFPWRLWISTVAVIVMLWMLGYKLDQELTQNATNAAALKFTVQEIKRLEQELAECRASHLATPTTPTNPVTPENPSNDHRH